MIKRLLFSLLFLTTVVATNAQTVIEAKQVKAVDSLKLKTDWITNIIKDSSLTGATVRNFPSTDAVIKYIANRLAYTVKYGDTAAILTGYVRENRFIDSLTAVQLRIQGKLTKADADTYYPAIQRVMDSLTNVQQRIQEKLTKADADGYYPATQRMIDSLVALQNRIQEKLTKADADTYYPAIQRMIDSLSALQLRLQGKEPLLGFTPVPNTRTINGYALTGNVTITKSDVGLGNVDNTSDANKPISTATQTALDGKQNTIGYTPENVANKATDFTTVNNTLYPTVQAVVTHTQSALTGVLKDRGNYNASSNLYPSSGGSGSGGAIQQGNMWYISVGGTLGGTTVYAGDWVRALVDAPGQTSSNWAIAGGSFGFTPENSANKSTNTSLGTSNTLYPTQNAVKTYVDNATSNASNWNTAYSWGNHASAGYPLTSGSYSNPSWITSLAWSKLTGVPSTFTPSAHTHPYSDLTGTVPTWNQNTTGNAATATNATQWNGYPLNTSSIQESASIDAVIAKATGSGNGLFVGQTGLRTFLGLGSYAYRSSGLAELSGATFTGGISGTTLNLSGTLTADVHRSVNGEWLIGKSDAVNVTLGSGDISNRVRIVAGGLERIYFNTNGDEYRNGVNKATTGNATYKHSEFGGINILYRDGIEAQINSNLTYNSSNQYVASYTNSNGAGILTFTGGELNWYTYDGSVTAGNAYSISSKFNVTKSGFVTATSFIGAGTGLTGTASGLSIGGAWNGYTNPATTHGGAPDFFVGTSGTEFRRYTPGAVASFINGQNFNIGGNAATSTYATNSTRLYASDGSYVYGGAAPYYMYMTYDGVRWRLRVSPATPADVRVDFADNATNWNGQPFLGAITGGGEVYFMSSTGSGFGYSTISATKTALGLSNTSDVSFANLTAKTYSENTVTVSSSYTVASDVGTVFCDSHTYTVTLPSASSFPGREITIKRISSGVGTGITISGVTLGSSESGGSLGCHGAAVYKSNGTSWYCIAFRSGGCD